MSLGRNWTGNATLVPGSVLSFESTTLWPIITINCITIAFIFSKGKPFRKPIYTNCKYMKFNFFFLFFLFLHHSRSCNSPVKKKPVALSQYDYWVEWLPVLEPGAETCLFLVSTSIVFFNSHLSPDKTSRVILSTNIGVKLFCKMLLINSKINAPLCSLMILRKLP